MSASSPLNLVFVDFENVPRFDPAVIGAATFHFALLLGARQTRMDTALVEKLMAHAGSVQLVRLTTAGRNALDFILAYHVGRAVQSHPAAAIHIVSKDTGFDALIEHLRSRAITAQRHDDFATLLVAPRLPPSPGPSEDLCLRALEHLRRNASSRPKRRKTLASHLLAFLGRTSTAAEVEGVIEWLLRSGHIRLGDKDAITYHVGERLQHGS